VASTMICGATAHSSHRGLLITGGSRGIGAATARLAATRGWDVAINFHSDAVAAQAVADEVQRAGRRALLLQADVADEAEVMAMFAESTRLGPAGGLVNNAGVVDVQAAWTR
jgi:NAD(P)-dependent dehydrogenase (short-subunit alcohol dehydrogenase family)